MAQHLSFFLSVSSAGHPQYQSHILVVKQNPHHTFRREAVPPSHLVMRQNPHHTIRRNFETQLRVWYTVQATTIPKNTIFHSPSVSCTYRTVASYDNITNNSSNWI